MKHLLYIILFLLAVTNAFANHHFDETVNYQFNDAKAYIGETLFLMPVTGAQFEFDIFGGEQTIYYNFRNYSFNEKTTSRYDSRAIYKYDGSYGTHKRYLEKHRFYVNDVKPYADGSYKRIWVFYLTDLNTGEKLKYVYDAEYYEPIIDFMHFPFMVEKHLNYCKSLVGTKLVFATNTKCNKTLYDLPGYYRDSFKKDIYTGETINYTEPYAKWTIKSVGLDTEEECIYFIVSNGKNTTKVYNDNEYAHRHPKYNIGNRVFPEKIWDELVEKYGEQHMSLIMQTKVSNDMTLEEKYMAGGGKLAKQTNKKEPSTTDVLKKLGNDVIQSTKKTASDGVTIFKSIFK